MDFLQSLRVSELTNQLNRWSDPTTVSNYYGDLDKRITPSNGLDDFVVQRSEGGYFTVENNTIKFEDLANGRTFVLRKNFKETDHLCYTDLYDAGISTNKFRCNKLDYREVIAFGAEMYEYLEFSSPAGEYGNNAVSDYFFNPVVDFKSFAMGNIDEVKNLIFEAKKVAQARQTGFPDFSLILWDQWKDSKGTYWQEILDWNISANDSISWLFMLLENMVELNQISGKITANEAAEILAYAKESWK